LTAENIYITNQSHRTQGKTDIEYSASIPWTFARGLQGKRAVSSTCAFQHWTLSKLSVATGSGDSTERQVPLPWHTLCVKSSVPERAHQQGEKSHKEHICASGGSLQVVGGQGSKPSPLFCVHRREFRERSHLTQTHLINLDLHQRPTCNAWSSITEVLQMAERQLMAVATSHLQLHQGIAPVIPGPKQPR
jgi:hypothetical protein